MPQFQRVAVLRRLIQDIALGPDVADERHHQLFADGIDGRIGDLRKQLLEIIEQRLRLVAKGRPAAYRCPWSRRLFAFQAAMGSRIIFRSSSRIAEGPLPHQDGVVIGRMHVLGSGR